MSLIIKIFKASFFVLALVWLAGCVQYKTTPGYARTGDYIVLGLGGVERNTNGAAALKPSDLTITLTDANSVDHELRAQYVFKSYVDYGTWMNSGILSGREAIFGLTDMVPFDGGWFAVAPLTYPGLYTSPLPLAVGPAMVSVTSPKLTNIASSAAEGDLSAIPIDIIAGISPHDNDFQGQFFSYVDSGRNFVILPSDLTGITEVAGAFLVINYNDDSFLNADVEPMVVPSDHNPFVQLSYNHVANGDGTGTLYVSLLNPAGFKTLATASQNSSLLSSLAVKLMYFPAGTGLDIQVAAAKASFSVDATSSYYIGMDGAILSGITPVMTHIADL